MPKIVPPIKLCTLMIVGLAALSVRFSITTQDLAYLDRIFLPDDTYYTLSISRNIAESLIPSVNGEILTSGFQPLTAFIIAPFFAADISNDNAVLISILLSASFGVLSCVMLTNIIFQQIKSNLIAAIGGLITATSPLIIRNDLNGLETSLAMFLSLFAISLYLSHKDNPSKKIELFLGVIIGLMVLARIDTAFIAALIGVAMLLTRGLKTTFVVSITATLVVLPWWAYCTVQFGSPIPESGAAVKQLVEPAGGQQLPLGKLTYLASNTILSSAHISILPQYTIIIILIIACVLIAAATFSDQYKADGVAILMAGGVISGLFYLFYLPAFWFFHRYLHICFFSITMCIAMGAWIFSNHYPKFKNRVVGSFGFLILLINIQNIMPFYSKPAETLYSGADGAKGYREVAIQILSSVPDGATVGSAQSGALSYYADRNIKIINLDGVVDRNAYNAIKDKKLSEFIISREIKYIAGWDINMSHMILHSERSTPIKLHKIAQFKKQGIDQFSLYSVVLPQEP